MSSDHVDPVTSDLPGKHRSDGADWERRGLLEGLAIFSTARSKGERPGRTARSRCCATGGRLDGRHQLCDDHQAEHRRLDATVGRAACAARQVRLELGPNGARTLATDGGDVRAGRPVRLLRRGGHHGVAPAVRGGVACLRRRLYSSRENTPRASFGVESDNSRNRPLRQHTPNQ